MKLLSIAIPCYNSAAYMENCIKSLLPGGNEVEILIVDEALSVGDVFFQAKCYRKFEDFKKELNAEEQKEINELVSFRFGREAGREG